MRRIPLALRPILIGALVGLSCVAASTAGLFDGLSERVTDVRFFPYRASPFITVVAIDDASIAQLGRWPWPRRVHATLVRNLAKAGIKVIAYDVSFTEVSEEGDDADLEAALREAGNVVLPVELQVVRRGDALTYDMDRVLPPLPRFAAAAAGVGSANVPPDRDGVARMYPLYLQGPEGGMVPSFASEALRVFGRQGDAAGAPLDALGRLRMNFPDGPMRGFRIISAVDVARGTADLSALAGTVAFVGATAGNLHDLLLVPTSHGLPMPGVEVHASAFDTVLQRKFLMPVPGWAVALLMLALGALGGSCAAHLKTRWALAAMGATLLAIAVTSFLLFDQGSLLDIVWPILALLLSYVAAMIERRLSSDKERRQVTQAFSRYVSRSVVESILRDPSRLRLGGERRRVSVLFSDIRGFTSMSEGMGPDALVALLNTYLSRMTDIVFAHEGVLDKYIGDAVMAFWNAPFDQPDHARRAVDTALDMQATLGEMNRAKAFGDVTIGIGVGISTGDVVVGNIGGQQRFEYTVIGDNVNLASRLEALTRVYNVGVIVTSGVREALGDGYLLRSLDKVAVKGKKEQVLIFEVMARADRAEPWQRKLATDFDAALDAYFARDFEGAVTRCADLLALRSDDGPSKLLKARAEHFQKEPPAPDWDGRWTYTKK